MSWAEARETVLAAYGDFSTYTLRIVDGPDEVHRNQIARLELKKHSNG